MTKEHASNYSIAQQNVLGSLETEEARTVFLRACNSEKDDRLHYYAEGLARKIDLIQTAMSVMLPLADERLTEEQSSDLNAFIMKRARVYLFDDKFTSRRRVTIKPRKKNQ